MSYRSYYISFYIKAKLDNYVYITDDAESFRAILCNGKIAGHISAIATPTTTAKLRIAHDCSNYTTDDTFQVADVRCIDLTDSGLTGWTKSNLTLLFLICLIGGYIIAPTQLKSIGIICLIYKTNSPLKTLNYTTKRNIKQKAQAPSRYIVIGINYCLILNSKFG